MAELLCDELLRLDDLAVALDGEGADVALGDDVVTNGDRMLDFARSYVAARVRVGLPAVDPEQFMYARAAQSVTERMKRVDLLTGRDVAAAVRSANATANAVARERRFQNLVDAVESHVRRHRPRLAADAELENTMLAHRGKRSVPTDLLIVRSAFAEVREASKGADLPNVSTQHIIKRMETTILARSIDDVRTAMLVPRLDVGRSTRSIAR